MKHGKKPTRSQKILIELRGLDPENWLIERDTVGELVILHRKTGSIKTIKKGA